MHKNTIFFFLERRRVATTFPLLHISSMQQFLVKMQPLEMNNIILQQSPKQVYIFYTKKTPIEKYASNLNWQQSNLLDSPIDVYHRNQRKKKRIFIQRHQVYAKLTQIVLLITHIETRIFFNNYKFGMQVMWLFRNAFMYPFSSNEVSNILP